MRQLLWFSLWLVISASKSNADSKPDLIYYGWDSPEISSLAQFITTLPTSPFAGAGIFTKAHGKVFRTMVFPTVEYQDEMLQLSQLKPGVLGHSYLVINTTTDAEFDWLSDMHWQATLKNTAMLARLAKAGGFSGILFDMEPYGFNLWKMSALTDKHPMAYAQAQILMENRGKSMMQTIEAEFPHPQMFFLWGLSAEQDWTASLPALTPTTIAMSQGPSGLWPAFFGGMVKAASANTRIIDGNERSYYFSANQDYADARGHIVDDLAYLLPEDTRSAYAEKVEVGQAVYADYLLNSSDTPRQFGYFLANEDERLHALESHVAYAMANAQSIAWYYAEKSGWWSNPSNKVTDAINRGKRAANLGPTAALIAASPQAMEKWAKRRTISGKFIATDGILPPEIHFAPDLAHRACSIDASTSNYFCVLPDGISITLKPQAANVMFDPAQKEITDLGGNLHGLNWTVQKP